MTLRHGLSLIVLPALLALLAALWQRQRALARRARVFEGLLDELYARRPLLPGEGTGEGPPEPPART
ncbi:hypothetical protein [Rubellimicrobium aerolatum]|uniref:Uncharacterized protein n=1 Tax=Rubellimicrobium aerolatum TaxID=490979 RepID=A0ABW0S8U8_9RHOB|nr:hypothetical protein [Rubellimicrobium aerolatum]MBP1804689.1 hypothetical protein [Rubellimicrobium aerolatum]